MNEDGAWSGNERTLDLHIAPTLVQTVWFKLTCVVAGVLLLWLGFVAGVVLGALSFGSGNSSTLWAASAAALILALLSTRIFAADEPWPAA